METSEYICEQRYMNKESWGDGPWQNEPDRSEWRHLGLACLIVRSNSTGALCGYVGCPPGHPFHGASYDKVAVDVHGGLTFAGPCDEHGSICHVPLPGEPDNVFWLGFDCGHCFDEMPLLRATIRQLHGGDNPFEHFRDETYRDLAYVRAEVERLAEQVAKASSWSVVIHKNWRRLLLFVKQACS